MGEDALVIENLQKRYGAISAVKGISFRVKRGSLFAFLGINGAGKSTTINIICSILKKDGGRILVNGLNLDTDAQRIKNEIGIVFQSSVLDQDLTAWENLKIRTAFYPLQKEERKRNLESIVKLLELEPLLQRTVRTLSGGQKRRLDIARAMVHRPRLLILDEPTTGLDPKTRRTVWSLIDRIRAETGMTVFLTTHYLEEAERATDVVIMDDGAIIAQGTPVELKNRYSHDSVWIYTERHPDLERALDLEGRNYAYYRDLQAYKLLIRSGEDVRDIVNRYASEGSDIEIRKGTMDDVFLNVTGKNIRYSQEEHDDDDR